jgi:hypothetical protein
MSVKSKLESLRKILGPENFFLAEAFIDKNLKPLKIRKNSNLYAAAVEYVGTLFEQETQILTDREVETLTKDNLKNKVGVVHKKLKKEFDDLLKLNELIEGEKKNTRTQAARPLPDPIPAAAAKKEPPEVTLETNKKRVQKGDSATVTWNSKNAVRIARTNIPGVTTRSSLSGSIEVEDIRRRRDLYIVVESLTGQKAEAKTQILVETQQYQRKRERGVIEDDEVSPPPPPPRPSLTTLVSPSTRAQPQTRTRPEPTAESSNINNNILLNINKSLTNIAKVLSSQLKLGQRVFDMDRRSNESATRLKKEQEMEEKDGGIPGGALMKAGAEKMLSPFKTIIDKIINFIVYTFLGRAFTEIIKWVNDPKNSEKVDALGKFLKMAWPAILGLSLLFLTPLGGFILGTAQFLIGTAKTLRSLKLLIDKLIFKKGAKPPTTGSPKSPVGGKPKVTVSGEAQSKVPFRRGPKITGDVQSKGFKLPNVSPGAVIRGITNAGIGLAGSFAIDALGEAIQGGASQNIVSRLQQLSPEQREEKINQYKQIIKTEEEYQKSPLFLIDKIKNLGGETESERITRFFKNILKKSDSYSTGGQIFSGLVTEKDGVKVSGAGKDTQAFPVMGGGTAVLQPGEVVLNKAGVKNALSLGIDPLKLNTGPNANKPVNITTGIKAIKSGGVVWGMRNMPSMAVTRKMPSMNINSINNITNRSTNLNISNNMSMRQPTRMTSNISNMSMRQPTRMRSNMPNMSMKSPMSISSRSFPSMGSSYKAPRSMSMGSMSKPFIPQMRRYESSGKFIRKIDQTSYSKPYDSLARSTSTVYQSPNQFQILRASPTLNAPEPLSRARRKEPIMLPPITMGQDTIGSSAGSGTQLPVFGATCPSSSAASSRKILCDIYGIIV